MGDTRSVEAVQHAMQTRTHTRFKIFGTGLSPEEISERIGLMPTRVLRAGDTRPHTTIVEAENLWELKSELPEECHLAEHVEWILKRVSPFANRIREVSTSQTVLLSCIVHSDRTPPISLSKEAIQELADLNAEVDFDLYIGEV